MPIACCCRHCRHWHDYAFNRCHCFYIAIARWSFDCISELIPHLLIISHIYRDNFSSIASSHDILIFKAFSPMRLSFFDIPKWTATELLDPDHKHALIIPSRRHLIGLERIVGKPYVILFCYIMSSFRMSFPGMRICLVISVSGMCSCSNIGGCR